MSPWSAPPRVGPARGVRRALVSGASSATLLCSSDFHEACAREPCGLDGVFELLGDDEGHAPAPGPEETGACYLRRVDAQAMDGAILAEFLRLLILGLPVLDFCAPCVVDTADDAQGVEDE